MADKPKLDEAVAGFLPAKVLQNIHAWAAKSWWQACLVAILLGGLGGLADYEFGVGNAVTKAFDAPVPVTSVQLP